MQPANVLAFWLGQQTSNPQIAASQSALWWQKNADTDQTILERFEPLLKAIPTGQYDHWLESPEGRLALIIVMDQFTRNMYRDSPLAFSYDALALHLCLQGIKSGQDKELSLIQRVFFYLPLEHSESAAMQKLSIEKFQQIADEASDDFLESAKGFVDFAHKHQVIIEQFGRYPHRNEILKRSSTEAEIEFLKQPGSSF